jgi:hypothetical protein
VLGRLPSLDCLTLCGQQMGTVDSARCMVVLGRLLPALQVCRVRPAVCTSVSPQCAICAGSLSSA